MSSFAFCFTLDLLASFVSNSSICGLDPPQHSLALEALHRNSLILGN